MKKILSLLLSFTICVILRATDIWILFTPVFLILSYPNISESFWEIPFGVLITSILFIFLRDYMDALSSIFLVGASVIYAASKPKKLIVFYPIAIIALFSLSAPKSTAIVMVASIWCALRDAFFLRGAFSEIS